MFDAEDHDLPLSLVDPIQHTIGAPPSGVDAGEVPSKLFADSPWILGKGTSEEPDNGRRHVFVQPDRMARVTGGVRTSS